MIYLIVQTFILLLVAGLLGLLLGWYLTRISAANQRAALQARLSVGCCPMSWLTCGCAWMRQNAPQRLSLWFPRAGRVRTRRPTRRQ